MSLNIKGHEKKNGVEGLKQKNKLTKLEPCGQLEQNPPLLT